MRRIGSYWLALCLTGSIMALQITGCGKGVNSLPEETEQEMDSQTERAGISEDREYSDAVGRSEKTEADGRVIVTAMLGEGGEKSITYEPEDLVSEWQGEDGSLIELSEEGITAEGEGVTVSDRRVVIEKGGVYVVSGQMTEGQIWIEAGKDETVRLILNGVELSNTHTAPIYGAEKCKVILTLAEGARNVIRDGSEYQFETEGEDEPDAPIFTKGDLTINGTGELQVYGNYQSGIRSKDNLKVISGQITIEAMDDGLKGKDSVIIRDGLLTIQAEKDGIKSNEDQDTEKGFIWIDGGEITIAAKDDGIQAETSLIVCGGNIHVTECQEGLAGRSVDILGGLIKAVTEDDGINSAASVETEQEKRQNQEGVYTRIAGGEIWLNAKADGIDSNGDLYLEGGTLYLSGPTSRGDGILDYNGKATISGGTILAVGSSGMMQTFGEDSTQNYLVIYWEESQVAGTRIQLTDGEGQVLAEYTPEKAYDTAIISIPGMETGNVYCVKTGEGEEKEIEITVSGQETVSGTPSGRGMRGHDSGEGGGFGGRRPEGEEGEEPPEGFGRGGQGGEPPEGFEREGRGEEPPEGFKRGDRSGEPPEGFERGGEGGEVPEGFGREGQGGERPEGFERGGRGGERPEGFEKEGQSGELSEGFERRGRDGEA